MLASLAARSGLACSFFPFIFFSHMVFRPSRLYAHLAHCTLSPTLSPPAPRATTQPWITVSMQPHRRLFSMAAAASVFSLLALSTLAAPATPTYNQNNPNQQSATPKRFAPLPSDDMLNPPPEATPAQQATNPIGPPIRALGTRGVTDGEPTTAEAHCCGMKGLGGAKIDVMCHPGAVAMGRPFTVNVNFTSDVKRPVDVHVDVLNAQSKRHYAGAFKQFDTQAGLASLTIQMPPNDVQEPFLWKVFLTPRGEPFPNMLVRLSTHLPTHPCSSSHSSTHPPSLSPHKTRPRRALSPTWRRPCRETASPLRATALTPLSWRTTTCWWTTCCSPRFPPNSTRAAGRWWWRSIIWWGRKKPPSPPP
jgi:hypothetical protein